MNTEKNSELTGDFMYEIIKELFPINRSITGEGVRETLNYLKRLLPDLVIYSVSSGTSAFDWVVPDEWLMRAGWIEDEKGTRVVDFSINNLHVVGYSEPVDKVMDLEELQEYLFSLPDQPDAIPYVTSYYSRRWGFCIADKIRKQLMPGKYRVFIDSEIKPGALNYGELVIPGRTNQEILISTYICHPSMANNELSGPAVCSALARWISSLETRHYSYRFVFIPETIGSLVYLSRNLEHLKQYVFAGFNVTCIGDERAYSYLPSRAGDTPADRAAVHALKHHAPDFVRYSWLDRGSDERQYCAPGVDLPIASIMRTKYGKYPEYHTSLDNLELVSTKGLHGGLEALKRAIQTLEMNCKPRVTVIGEPQLGKRGLYPTVSQKGLGDSVRTMMNLISYCDGSHTLLEISEILNLPIWELYPIISELAQHKLIECSEIR